MMPYYSRKRNRLAGYDYSTVNYYFITICTYNKKCIFGKPRNLNEIGNIAESCIVQIQEHYANAKIINYIVMPNHIHMILALEGVKEDHTGVNISKIIGQYKIAVTKKVRNVVPDCNVWQRSFYDRIIRNQKEYEAVWNYIEFNDQKWMEDPYYVEYN